MKTIQANYVENFVCDPRYCKGYCCKKPNIIVDEKTLSKYKHIKPPVKSKEIMKNIKNDQIMLKAGECPFYDDRACLCSLAEDYGEEYMPVICRTFPHYLTQFRDCFAVNLSLVCNAACKMVLEQKEPIELVERDSNIKSGRLFKQYAHRKSKFLKTMQKYGLIILQNKDFSLDERMELLGNYLINSLNIEDENLFIEYSEEFLKNIESEAKKIPEFNKRTYLTKMTFVLTRLYGPNGYLIGSDTIGLTTFMDKVFDLARADQPDKDFNMDEKLKLYDERFLPAKNAFEEKYQNELTNMLCHLFLFNITPLLPKDATYKHTVNYLRLQYDFMMFILICAYFNLEDEMDFPTLINAVSDSSRIFEDDMNVINFFRGLSTAD